MWGQIAALAVGGGLKAFGGYDERKAQRNQMNKMIDTEKEFRQSLQANRESLRSDTRAGMTDAFIGMQTTGNQGTSNMMKSAYDNVSNMGRQGLQQYDRDIAQSVKMQQSLEAQKPKAYGASDFLSDFLGGGIQGYQAYDSFEQSMTARQDADIRRDQSSQGFQAWMDALKKADAQSESLINKPTVDASIKRNLSGYGRELRADNPDYYKFQLPSQNVNDYWTPPRTWGLES